VPDIADVPRWRLHLDVTALLLAANLDALPAVERAYGPLHIPADLVPALLEMRARAAPHQPMRERTYRQIVALVEGGAISVVDDAAPSPEDTDLVANLGTPWVALYRRADGEYILDYLPLQRMDDRFLNGYVRQERGAPIVGICEVLKGLRGVGELTTDAYYEKVGQLRAANIRYIPIETDEIMHHLRRARVVDSALVEHPEFATLRRYLAAYLAHARVLQPPALAGPRPRIGRGERVPRQQRGRDRRRAGAPVGDGRRHRRLGAGRVGPHTATSCMMNRKLL